MWRHPKGEEDETMSGNHPAGTLLMWRRDTEVPEGWRVRQDLDREEDSCVWIEREDETMSDSHPTDLPDNDLPGMWERADFMGGQEDDAPRVFNALVARAEAAEDRVQELEAAQAAMERAFNLLNEPDEMWRGEEGDRRELIASGAARLRYAYWRALEADDD